MGFQTITMKQHIAIIIDQSSTMLLVGINNATGRHAMMVKESDKKSSSHSNFFFAS